MKRKLLVNFEKFVRSRLNSHKQFVYSPFSSTFKRERLLQRKTLNSVVGKTCSLSYVSKFENNLILPEEDVLSILFDNVGIDYKMLKSSDMSNYLPEIMEAYLKADLKSLETMYYQAQTPYFIVQNALSMLFYYLATKQYVLCAETIEMIDFVKTTLNDYQLLVLASATIEFFIIAGRFREAYNLLKFQKYIHNKEYLEIKMLNDEQLFLIVSNINEQLLVYPSYYEIQMNFLSSYPLSKKIKNKLLYFESQWEEEDIIKRLDGVFSDYIPENYYLDCVYSRFLILIKKGLYKRIITEYRALESKDAGVSALYAYAILKLSQNPNLEFKLEEEKQNLDLIYKDLLMRPDNELEYLFIKLIIQQINKESIESIQEFMKIQIIPFLEIRMHRFYSAYFAKTYLEILIKQARYKEALNLVLKNLSMYI